MIQQNEYGMNAQKLLFVDAGVLDTKELLKDLQPGFKVIPLTSESDAITQISTALAKYSPINEITILSHAEPGSICFSNQSLDIKGLNNRDGEFINWSDSLTADAKICIYGCSLAFGEIGQEFIHTLKRLTGAEIASSSLPVGKVDAGQNWSLDQLTNPFEVLMPFHKDSMANYVHRLEPVISINRVASILEIIEGPSSSRQLEFEVTLSEPATSTVDILYRTLDGASTATGGIDYAEETSFVRILASQSSATLNITVYGDNADEADESIIVELFNPENAVFADGAETLRSTGVILDDDGTANDRALFVSQVQVVEGDGDSQQAVFEVQLSEPSTSSITLDYTTADGSALAGQDYQASAGALTFAPGETLKAVAVPLLSDTVAEANEFFNLVFEPTPAIANGVDGAVGTAVILDDDTSTSLPEISISGGNTIEGSSSSRQLEFEVTLSEPATSTVDILYRTLDGASTATGGVDYAEETSFVRILAGQSSATLNITVYGDNADEADESIIVKLFNPENAVFADGAETLRSTGVILDDDGTANDRALFVSQVQVVEGDGDSQQAVFEVQLSEPSTSSITLDYTTADGSALAGQDYQASAGALTFAPGETLKAVAVPLLSDTVAEANEFFNLVFEPTPAIANGMDGAVGTAVILDDDTSTSLPEISISGGNTIEGSSSSRQLEFEVTLSEPATSTVDILYRTLDGASTATGGVDYAEETSFVRILAGQSSATLNITVYGDNADEADESIIVKLFNPENAVFADGAETLRSTGVILDDDGTANDRALFVSQVQVVEGDGDSQQAVFEVQLSEPSTSSITLDYTTADGSALAGQDYQASAGALTFAPGETLKAVAVPLLSDTVAEANEFFNLVFEPTPAIANGMDGAVGTAVILDDDTSTSLPEISISGGNTIEGSSSSRQLEFEVTLSEPATSTVDILYRTLDGAGTATGGVDYAEETSFVRILAGQSSATLNITVYGDNADEADESIIVELFNPENAVFADGVDTLQATGIILDDDGASNKLGLFVENAQIVEGESNYTREVAVPIHLSRPSDQELTFGYQTADDSAQAGDDYTSEQSGTVTFLPGQTLAAAFVPITGDDATENDETFTLTVTPTAAIANGSDGATGTVTIIDGDVIDPRDNIIEGDQGNNTLVGTAGDDEILGLGGNDTLRGENGNDTLHGGDDNDVLYGGAGADEINGGAGWDIAHYGDSTAAVNIDMALTTQIGGIAQGDILTSIEVVTGSIYNDVILGNSARNNLRGGDGNDVLRGQNGNDVMSGQNGDDTLYGGAGNDDLYGNDGKDVFYGGAGADKINGGAGWDIAHYGDSTAAVNIDMALTTQIGGIAQGDILTSIEVVTGSIYNDVILGNSARNNLRGGDGNDVLRGQNGNDVMSGQNGDDTLYGGAGNDDLYGNDGKDVFYGGAGADKINGGAGWDIAHYGDSTAAVNIDMALTTQIGGIAQGDILTSIEVVTGSIYNDVILGNSARNNLRGGDGNDVLRGQNGNDVMSGQNGDDTLYGGAGNDDLYGNDGADRFVFEAISAFTGIDTVKDFKLSQNDALDISDLLSGYDPLSDAIEEFVQITDSGANSLVSVDTNGDGDNFVQIATLIGVTSLTNEETLETSGNLITV